MLDARLVETKMVRDFVEQRDAQLLDRIVRVLGETLATAVIGGLVVATIITLLLVPVVFTLLVDLSEFLRRQWRRALSVR